VKVTARHQESFQSLNSSARGDGEAHGVTILGHGNDFDGLITSLLLVPGGINLDEGRLGSIHLDLQGPGTVVTTAATSTKLDHTASLRSRLGRVLSGGHQESLHGTVKARPAAADRINCSR